jgi:hypothetical protein
MIVYGTTMLNAIALKEAVPYERDIFPQYHSLSSTLAGRIRINMRE